MKRVTVTGIVLTLTLILSAAMPVSATPADSSWEPPVALGAGAYYEALYAADVDGDGLDEILAGNWATNRVEVWDYDTSTSLWSMASYIQQPYSIRGISTGDYDEDGDIDIATAIRSYGVYVTFNENSGWSVPVGLSSEYGWHVTTCDLNNDGHLDILAAQLMHERIYYGDGTGSFVMDHNPIGLDDGVPTPDLYSKGFLSPVDLDNDGDLDLAGTWFQGGWWYYPDDRMDYFLRGFINKGNDGAGKVIWGVSASEVLGFLTGYADWRGYSGNILMTSSGYSTGDVNEDGYIDIVAKNLNAKTLVVSLGYLDGTGKLGWTTTTVDTVPDVILGDAHDYPSRSNIRLIDINKDCHLDIICSGYNQYDGLTIYYGDGSGTFIKSDMPLDYGLNSDGAGSAVGDFNGDGTLDMALPRYTTYDDGFEVWLQIPIPKDPETLIQNLVSDIGDMELPQGIENSLVSKLANALKSLDKGNDGAAINQINAFINQVEAQSEKKIPEEIAGEWINKAHSIIEAILEAE